MPGQKRARIDKACQSCVASKVRCQDLLPAGCLRCRRRQDECSLAGTTGEVPLAPSETLTALSDKIDALSDKLGRHTMSIPTETSSSQATSSNAQPSEPWPIFVNIPTEIRSLPRQAILNGAGGGKTVVEVLGRLAATAREEDYPNIAQEAQMGPEQMDAAFQLFKHRITSLLPLHPYTLASTKCPDHRFLQLCTLTFTPNLATSALQSLIDRSLVHAMCGAISKDVVQGLLLLSLSPLTPPSTELTRCCLSPVSLIGLAYSMGLSLGLEEQSRAALRRGATWAKSWNSTQVEAFLMWEMVKARYRMLHFQLSQASFGSMPTCLVNDIPSIPPHSISTTIEYLQQEYLFTCFAKPVLDILSPAEAEAIPTEPQTAKLLVEVWGQMCLSFDNWRQGGEDANRLLDIEAVTIPFMLTVRIMTCFQNFPSPVSADWRLQGVLQLVGPLTEMGHRLIALMNTRDISDIVRFPTHIHSIIAIAICAAQRMLHQASAQMPDQVAVQAVVEAERRLRLCGMELPVVMEGWNRKEESFGAPGMDPTESRDWADLWQTFLNGTIMAIGSVTDVE